MVIIWDHLVNLTGGERQAIEHLSQSLEDYDNAFNASQDLMDNTSQIDAKSAEDIDHRRKTQWELIEPYWNIWRTAEHKVEKLGFVITRTGRIERNGTQPK